jgi:hypothetical protein
MLANRFEVPSSWFEFFNAYGMILTFGDDRISILLMLSRVLFFSHFYSDFNKRLIETIAGTLPARLRFCLSYCTEARDLEASRSFWS